MSNLARILSETGAGLPQQEYSHARYARARSAGPPTARARALHCALAAVTEVCGGNLAKAREYLAKSDEIPDTPPDILQYLQIVHAVVAFESLDRPRAVELLNDLSGRLKTSPGSAALEALEAAAAVVSVEAADLDIEKLARRIRFDRLRPTIAAFIHTTLARAFRRRDALLAASDQITSAVEVAATPAARIEAVLIAKERCESQLGRVLILGQETSELDDESRLCLIGAYLDVHDTLNAKKLRTQVAPPRTPLATAAVRHIDARAAAAGGSYVALEHVAQEWAQHGFSERARYAANELEFHASPDLPTEVAARFDSFMSRDTKRSRMLLMFLEGRDLNEIALAHDVPMGYVYSAKSYFLKTFGVDSIADLVRLYGQVQARRLSG
jgi:hypothetical protein